MILRNLNYGVECFSLKIRAWVLFLVSNSMNMFVSERSLIGGSKSEFC